MSTLFIYSIPNVGIGSGLGRVSRQGSIGGSYSDEVDRKHSRGFVRLRSAAATDKRRVPGDSLG